MKIEVPVEVWVWIDDVINIFTKSKKSYFGKGTILGDKDRGVV